MTHCAIVLAAGMGSRLAGFSATGGSETTGSETTGSETTGSETTGSECPKPLKAIAGVPMLVRVLRTLQSEGVREAVIVVGHEGRMIEEALSREPSLCLRLTFVHNHLYEKKNGVSLLAAAAHVEGECLLSMADHLYSPEIVRRLVSFDLPAGACALAVDHDVERCFDIDDATKVRLSSGRISDIGKELERFDAIDTGVFRIGPALVAELRRVYEERGDCSLSEGVEALARSGRMFACGIGDARWIDVDTPAAAQRAEAMLHVFGESLGDEPSSGARPDPAAIELFAPSWVRAATPYNEDHFELAERHGDVARMMSNESPYRPSARVVEAVMQAVLGGNLYPSRGRELRERLGAREGVGADNVILGAGSAELIDLAVRTFVAPGEEVLISVPTFSMYEARTRTAGGIPVMIPMTDDGAFDISALIGAITERTKLVFLCTPNNPTGNRIAEADLRRILALGLPTVIDEAYYEFADDGRSLHFLVAEFPNALVLRTFSKAYGLAGMRVGYALGHPAHIRLLSRVKVPWNLSSLAIAAACATLDDHDEQAQRAQALRDGRAYLEAELARMPGVRVMPSEANFVLLDAQGTGMSAEAIVDEMLQRGFFIRLLRSHRAGGSLVRISVGDADHNTRCVHALRSTLARRSLPEQRSARVG
jgi:histidinol-phosphate aminotransferase